MIAIIYNEHIVIRIDRQPAKPSLSTTELRKVEHAAFLAWIKAAVADYRRKHGTAEAPAGEKLAAG